MNYENMSDGEITWRVHHVVNKIPDGYATICTADYCNNPSDAWPIITENHIHICFGSELTTAKAFTYTELVEVVDKNPLRAAMICFLKMKDAEKWHSTKQ